MYFLLIVASPLVVSRLLVVEEAMDSSNWFREVVQVHWLSEITILKGLGLLLM